MPKISALPPAGTLADDDETPFVDDSVAITKKFTLSGLLTWLASKTSWIVTAMIADGAVTAAKRSQMVASGFIAGSTLNTTGNKAVTGLGFTPKIVMFSCPYSGGSAYDGRGMMTSSDQWAKWTCVRAIATNNVAMFNNYLTTRCYGESSLSAGGAEVSTVQTSYVSMDADGFTINVNSTNAATNGLEWIAIG